MKNNFNKRRLNLGDFIPVTPPTEETNNFQSKKSNRNNDKYIPVDILNDLSSRFIINVPAEERIDPVRICFQIELAHWFYLDFYCKDNSNLPQCNIREFICIIFQHIPFLRPYASQFETIIEEWRQYKKSVPTFGAILLDQKLQNVLLVQGIFSRSSWGFPKGKVNKEEMPHDCAIREVYEETGYKITHLLDQNEFLEYYFNEQLIRLYIITGVPKDAEFQPKTRQEIGNIKWFPLDDLPSSKKEIISKSGTNFFLVIPFVTPLRNWITERRVPSPLIENLSQSEFDGNRQQELFAQCSKNVLNEYLQMKEDSNSEKLPKQQNTSTRTRTPTRHKSAYTPPPRMIHQRNLKQAAEKKNNQVLPCAKTTSPLPHKRFYQKAFNDLIKNNPEKKKTVGLSKTWENFSLDTEALIASFSVSLRFSSMFQ